MGASITPPPALSRLATVATVALLVLGVGIVFSIRCGSNNNSHCQEWHTRDGRQQAYMTSSGTLALSGSVIAGGVTLGGAVTAGQGLTKTSNVLSLTASHSGTIIKATTTLSSSGGLVIEGTTSGATFIGNTFSGQTIRSFYRSPRWVAMVIVASGSTVATGSGKAMLTIGDPTMSGYYLKSAHLSVETAGTTNATSVQIRDAAKANRKLFSTPIQIDTTKTTSDTSGTPAVISAANRDVGAYDRLLFDIPAVSTTVPKGDMEIWLEFYKP